VRATLTPPALRDGDDLTVRVSGLGALGPGPATVEVARVDTVETSWTASLGGEITREGTLEAVWSAPSLGRECAVFVTSVERAGVRHPVSTSGVSVVNATKLIATSGDASVRRAELQTEQEHRYAAGPGDPNAPDVREHRVVCAVERLLVTRRLRLPGVAVLPVPERPRGDEQRLMTDHVVQTLGWPTRIDEQWWGDQVAGSRPWTAIVCEPVWATGRAEAAKLAWSVRDDLVAILGLNRGARGRPVATVVEQRQPDDAIKYRVYVEDASYRGNLIGGFASGEDQSQLLAQHAAVGSDPLLRLCVDLYAEALGDPSPDARYLRIWSLLETLSGRRLPAGQVVTRTDGTVWPGSHATTDSAAPRVYALLAEPFRRGHVDESSSVGPAADLYEAVRVWYARRNATGHYGRFDSTDARQRGQAWFSWAQKTLTTGPGGADVWLMALEHNAANALNRELMAAGAAAVK
jgi:hypothetical protein